MMYIVSSVDASSLTSVLPSQSSTMQLSIVQLLPAAILFASTASASYLDIFYAANCQGTIEFYQSLGPDHTGCIPQQGTSLFLSTTGFPCTATIYSGTGCEGSVVASVANNANEASCLGFPGIGESVYLSCGSE